MSYILDALKRADADRERGHVPGLHSQTTGLATAGPSGHPLATRFAVGPRPALLAALVLALLAAAVAAWWWTRPAGGPVPAAERLVLNAPDHGDTPVAPAPVAPVTPAPVAPAAPAEPAPPASASASASSAAASPAGPDTPVLPILAPPVAVPAPAAAGPSAKASARAGADSTPAVSADPVAAPPAPDPNTAPSPAPATPAVRRFADLPPETRAQLPAVSVSGSTYSQNPAHRMLIANGQVVQEGGEIAPGLTLETIGPRSAVLNHRGVRYSIGY